MSPTGVDASPWLRRTWARRPPWADLVLYVAVLIQGTVSALVGDRGWFSGDVLHYFVERGGLTDGSEGLNEPHAGHWQAILIVVYRVLFQLFGLRTYLPYLLLTVLVHLALVVLLYKLLVHLGVDRWLSLGLAAVVLTYGAGSEAFVVEAPVALTSTLALGLVSLLLLVRADFSTRSLWLVNAILLISVMLSVGGVVAAVWVGCFALSRGPRMLLRSVALPAVAFTGWFLWQGRSGDRLYIEGSDWLRVPDAALTLLVQPFGDVAMAPALGAFLVVAAVFGTLLSAKEHPVLASLALAGVVAALLHCVLAAVAQVPFGTEQVLTSRYRYVVLVLLIPAAALTLQTLGRLLVDTVPQSSRGLISIVGALLAVAVLTNAALGQQGVARFVADTGDLTQARLRGMLAAVSTGETPINDAVRGDYVSGFDLARLTEPDARSEIPDVEVNQDDRIDAESKYFVAVTAKALEQDVPPAKAVTSSSFTEPLDVSAAGCGRYLATSGSPTLSMLSYNGGVITVTSRASTITTTLVRDELGVRGDPQTWSVTPGVPITIATTAQVARLDVAFDSGDYFTICAP